MRSTNRCTRSSIPCINDAVDISLAGWLTIVFALAAANLPFLSERLFAVIALPSKGAPPVKTLWWRLLELIVLYFIVGLSGRLLEGRIGTVFEQHWEFYAIGAVVFVVFAYPGFAFRYLRKRHG